MSAPLDPLSVPLPGSRLIEASAGTGKTWTIAALYLRLVLGHGDDDTTFARPLPPAQILVMTFTVAATRDLARRIRERLVQAASAFRSDAIGDDDPFLRDLVAAYRDSDVRERAAWRLAAAAEAMDDAAVVTIDAWVQRVLREHAFDSGSVFDETLEPDVDAMLADAARDYWRQQVYPLSGAALADAEACWPTVDALIDDARALVSRVDVRDDDGRSLEDVHDEAARRRSEAVAEMKAGWSERFESMRRWIAEGRAAKEHGPFKPRALSTADKWLRNLVAWAEDVDRVDHGLTKDARHRLSPAGMHECASDPASFVLPPEFQAFADLADPTDLDDTSGAMRLHAARRIKRRIQSLKERAGIFGFQDQLERLDRALDGPTGGQLRRRIVAQYPAALIDEFQDTSPIQYRIFDRVYRIADDDRATALFLIGDPKQLIYAFRDADITSYLRARAATSGRHYRLTTNHRSTHDLVGAINHLFVEAESRGDGAFRFGVHEDRPLPFVRVDARGRDATFVTSAGDVPALTIVHDATLRTKGDLRRHFAELAAEHVATTLADPRAGFVDRGGVVERLRPRHIAVLVRDRIEAAAMRRAFERRGVGSTFLSDQDSVFATGEAADLVPWLRAVASPRDGRLARIAFATPLIGASIAELAANATDHGAFETRIAQLEALARDWRERGVLSMLRRTLHLLDLPRRWLDDGGERRLTNVLHLAELLQVASARLDGEETLIRWLADKVADGRKRSDDEILRLESDADLIRIVTVHGAKGLQYRVVFLPFASLAPRDDKKSFAWFVDDDGTRQLSFRIDAETATRVALDASREDLRLLYVALTRAEHAVWLGVGAQGYHGRCLFDRSALGYLLGGGAPIAETDIASSLVARFGSQASTHLVEALDDVPVTRVPHADAAPELVDAPHYDATFERDWSIGSFSALVRNLARLPLVAAVDPAVEEEVLSGPVEEADVAVPSPAARHRFPRGAYAGNFLHDQLEWLATQRFALDDVDVRDQLVRRCERQGWARRADDVVAWLGEVVSTSLPPIGASLAALPKILPEMEFWLPSERVDAARIDALCRIHLLGGRDRPPLPDRTLRGMLMGFADLVFESDGRYWVLDYKSNALGDTDADYTIDAIERSMAAHRYDVQGALYLVALHRLLRSRLGDRYDPSRHLGGALYLFIRGIEGPAAGCCVLPAAPALIDAFDAALRGEPALA